MKPQIGVVFPGNIVMGAGEDQMKVNGGKTNFIKIIPNPVNNSASVHFNAAIAGKYSLQVRYVAGRLLLAKTGDAINRNNTISFDATRLKSGIYFLQVFLENEQRQTTLPFDKH